MSEANHFCFWLCSSKKRLKEITIDGGGRCNGGKFFFFWSFVCEGVINLSPRRDSRGQRCLCRYAKCYCYICIAGLLPDESFLLRFSFSHHKKDHKAKRTSRNALTSAKDAQSSVAVCLFVRLHFERIACD